MTSKPQIFHVPIFLTLGGNKKKKYYLNLNNYNTWHFQVKNNLKKKFKVITIETIRKLVPVAKCELTYTIFYPTKRKFDLDNVCSIISKFTNDVLSEAQAFPDDNYTVLPRIIYEFGGIDKENPRAEVTVREIKCQK